MRRAKIVSTLGPSTSTPERIRELVSAGMDVARLNLSHGEHAVHGYAYGGSGGAYGARGSARAPIMAISRAPCATSTGATAAVQRVRRPLKRGPMSHWKSRSVGASGIGRL